LKNLFIRTYTGGIYVALTIGSILISKYTFIVFFAFLLSYTLFEFYRLCRNGDIKPQVLTGIILSLYLFVSFFLYDMKLVGENIFFGLVPLFMIVPFVELISKNKNPVQNIAYTFLGILYVAVPFSVLNFIVTPIELEPERYMPEILIGLFIIIWVNDSWAFLFGSWFGKTKMLERISPKKTWEGAIGGAVISIILAVILFSFLDFLSTFHVVILTILTVIAGTFGDLTESMIKRSFNVKDSGNLMPGHGGLLDRFDSLLFSAPVYYIYISIVINS
jgi:phosphatidate cytidylyltransferase